ncbi:MAG TPA: DUF427 domain-containing protein [Povalibacter sp.]|nr:DUF427 domain-containing protein [Povalibacter sp.]
MTRSPGHHQWPDHQIREKHLQQRMQVRIGEDVIADSNDVIRVDEDGHPARFYFPRSDVRMDKLTRTDTHTECPFKGTADYFSVNSGRQRFEDAVWTYEQPYEEHAQLQHRMAFYDDKVRQLQVLAV